MKNSLYAILFGLTLSMSAMADGTKTEVSAAIEAASTQLVSFTEVKFNTGLMCPSDRSCKEFLVTGRVAHDSEELVTLIVHTISTMRPGPIKATIVNP